MGRRRDAVLLIHGGDDGVGAAHRLVADGDRLPGLDVRQTVVVDDAQDLRLIDAGDGLGQLVVVNQHHLLAPRLQQVIPGQGAHHLLLVIQDGVAAVAALQHHLADIVDVIVQMEGDQALGGAGTVDGRGLIDEPVDAAGVQGCGDDAGPARVLQPGRIDIRLAQNEAGDLLIQRPTDHIRLAAAQDDAVAAVEQQVLAVLRQGDGHCAADGIHQVAAVAHDAALDNAQQVEQRNGLHPWITHGVQAERGDVAGGEHTVKRTVLVDHGNGGDPLLTHQLPRPVHGDGGIQAGRTVELQISDLGADVLDKAGWIEVEAFQHPVRLVADRSQMYRHILLLAQRVLQRGVGHGGHNGVGIRVAVTGHIDLIHRQLLLCEKCLLLTFYYKGTFPGGQCTKENFTPFSHFRPFPCAPARIYSTGGISAPSL